MTYRVLEQGEKPRTETHEVEETTDPTFAPGWRYARDPIGVLFMQASKDRGVVIQGEQDRRPRVGVVALHRRHHVAVEAATESAIQRCNFASKYRRRRSETGITVFTPPHSITAKCANHNSPCQGVPGSHY